MISLNDDQNRKRGIYWTKIVAILFVQILVLLGLAAMVVRYLEWSSETNRAEFMSATTPSASDPAHLPSASAPIERVKGRAACYRKL